MISRSRALERYWPLAAIAAVAFTIVVVRAVHQSVTWDEAATFLGFVWQRHPALWIADPNNHVLNSMLETLFVQMFGASPVTIRMPTMLGAVFYFAACGVLCARYMPAGRLRALSFACLVLNPFVLDYFVAARGYGLALGFLTAEICLLCLARELPRVRIRLTLYASIATGLSVASNFSFAVAAAVALLVFAVVFAWGGNERRRVRLGCALALPAPIVALSICGPALTTFDSKRELVYGAHSIGEMLGSVVSNSFDGPNPFIVNPNVMPIVAAFRDVAPLLIALAFIVAFVLLVAERTLARSPATPILAILVLTLVLEIVLAGVSHTLLPLNRTILFAAPLATLAGCFAIASVRLRVFGRAATVVVAATACFFALSVRSYFREWAFDSSVAQVYAALHDVEIARPGLTVVTDAKYFFGLNFYQAIDPHPKVPIVQLFPASAIPDSRALYVFSDGDGTDDAFVKQHDLTVIYSYPGEDSPNTNIATKSGTLVPVLPHPPIDHPGAL